MVADDDEEDIRANFGKKCLRGVRSMVRLSGLVVVAVWWSVVVPGPAQAEIGPEIRQVGPVQETCAALAEEEGLDPDSRVMCADIAALDQMLVYNRFGSFNPFGMIFALNRDVAPLAVAKEADLVDLTGATPITADDCGDTLGTETRATGVGLEAGAVRLRDCKRPRPLVLRANVGDTLAIHVTNLLAPAPGHDFSSDFCRREAPTADDSRERVRPEVMFAPDSPITDEADTATDGLDGWLRHGEATCLVPPSSAAEGDLNWPATRLLNFVVQGLAPLPMPGETRPHPACFGMGAVAPDEGFWCRYVVPQEGTYFFASNAAPTGGQGAGGSLVHGLFGAIVAERRGARYFRSQVTEAAFERAWPSDGTAPDLTRSGAIDYDAPDDDGIPLLDMVRTLADGDDATPGVHEIVHGDLNAIVYCDPNAGEGYCAEGDGSTAEPNYTAFREFSVFFHDELKTFYTRNFRELEDFGQLAGVRDGFAINYGASGMGAMLLANRKGIGPADDCMECLYEEFFLTSWANGDPALLEWFADDPSNVHHSYLNDPVVFRNFHAGPKETHVFHLHAHQWFAGNDPNRGSYLDSQTVAPQQGFTYNIYHGGLRGPDGSGSGWWGSQGSGNRNRTVGDSIFHCHLYPHFAQGMWALWRVHDVLEDGTRRLPDGQAEPGLSVEFTPEGGRPDARPGSVDRLTGEWIGGEGTPIPAVVPLPGEPIPLAPTYAAPEAVADTGELAEDAMTPFPGYPFYIAGRPGHRPPQAPLDIARNLGAPIDGEAGTDSRTAADAVDAFAFGDWLDGGLGRHVFGDGAVRALGIHLPGALTDEAAFHALSELEQVLAMRQVIAKAFALGDLSAHLEAAEIEELDPFGTRLERGAMGFHHNGETFSETGAGPALSLRAVDSTDPVAFSAGGYPTVRAPLPTGGGDADPPAEGENTLLFVNGAPPRPGAPFADPCGGSADLLEDQGDDPFTSAWLTAPFGFDPELDGFRRYEASAVQLDLIVNQAGWHDPQARINVLTEDSGRFKTGEGKISPYVSDSEQPFFFRAFSGECIEFRHTNELPYALELDDFQVKTPTDTIGQHIHLVKFDVTASDGSGNGWNYEDGTLAADEIAARLCAWREHAGEGSAAADRIDALEELIAQARARDPDAGIDDAFPEGVDFCESPALTDHTIWRLPRNAVPFLFQTTTQRWFADPILSYDENGVARDRTMRTVFTHDHFGPSSIQQHGFYSALVIEPPAEPQEEAEEAASDEAEPTDETIATAHLPQVCQGEGRTGCVGPLPEADRASTVAWGDERMVGTRMIVQTAGDNTIHPSYREFAISIADFALLYDPRDRESSTALASAVADTTGQLAASVGGMKGMGQLVCEAVHHRSPFNLRDVCGVGIARDGPGLSFSMAGDPPAWLAGGAFRDDIHKGVYQGDLFTFDLQALREVRDLWDHLVWYRSAAAGPVATGERRMASPVAAPARPESISVDHHDPYVVNYRGAPIALRIADKVGGAVQHQNCRPMGMARPGDVDATSDVESALLDGTFPECSYSHQLSGDLGDMGNALHSGLHGDPETPVLEAYGGERLVFRMIQGAQEVQHSFTVAGQPFKRTIDQAFPQGTRTLESEGQETLQRDCYARPAVAGGRPAEYREWWKRGADAMADPFWREFEAALEECDNIEGFVWAQEIGISEHFEMQGSLRSDVPASVEAVRATPSAQSTEMLENGFSVPTRSSDYLYHFGTVDALWNGAWGLVRIFEDEDALDPTTVSALNVAESGDPRPISERLLRVPVSGGGIEALNVEEQAVPTGTGLACPLPEFDDGGEVVTPTTTVSAVVVAVETRKVFDPAGTIYGEGVHDPDGTLLAYLPPDALPGIQSITDQENFDRLSADDVINALRTAYAGQPEPMVLRVRAGECLQLRVLNLLGEDDGSTRDLLGDAVLPPIVPLNADPAPHVDEGNSAMPRLELARLPDASAPGGVRPSAALGLTFGLPGLDLARDIPLGFGYNRLSLAGGFGGVSVGPILTTFAGRFTVEVGTGGASLQEILANGADLFIAAEDRAELFGAEIADRWPTIQLEFTTTEPEIGDPGFAEVLGRKFGLRVRLRDGTGSAFLIHWGTPGGDADLIDALCDGVACGDMGPALERLQFAANAALARAADDITHWVPYAFGPVPIRTTGDVISQGTHGLVGAIDVVPVTWATADTLHDCAPTGPDGYRRCAIRLPGEGWGDGASHRFEAEDPETGDTVPIREFVVFYQDGLNHWDEGSSVEVVWSDTGAPVTLTDGIPVRMVPDCPVCDDSYDRGEASTGYRSPALHRLLRTELAAPEIAASSDLNAHTFPADWPLAAAGQPRLQACEGEQIVIRVLQPSGRARQHAFAMHGYSYDELFPGFGFPRSALLAPGRAISAWLTPQAQVHGDEAQTVLWHDGPLTRYAQGIWGLLDVHPAESALCQG
jgi:manganese oxidase